MMPNLGQGGCQAIEDAYVLAEELGALEQRSGAKDALQRRERTPTLRQYKPPPPPILLRCLAVLLSLFIYFFIKFKTSLRAALL
jgi:hypothetical protein